MEDDTLSTRQKRDVQDDGTSTSTNLLASPPHGRLSLLQIISPDTVIAILGYFDHRVLAKIQPTSKLLFHYADLDTVWRPVVKTFLLGKLCLIKGIRERIAKSEADGPMSTGVSRQALKEAFQDSKRRIITKEEICGQRFNMRIRDHPSLPRMHQGIPEDFPPIYAQFNDDAHQSCQMEGEVPGSRHPVMDFHSHWDFVEPAMESLIPENGGASFMIPELRNPTGVEEMELLAEMGQSERIMHLLTRNDFTCFHWLGRPPLKVWRHPVNWSICMSHINCQYSSTKIPALGTDAAFDSDPPYIHPFNSIPNALGVRGGPRGRWLGPDHDHDHDGEDEDEDEDEIEEGEEHEGSSSSGWEDVPSGDDDDRPADNESLD